MKDDCVICKPAGKNESTSSLRGSKWGPEGFIWMVVEAQGKGMKPNNNAAVLPVLGYNLLSVQWNRDRTQ